MKATDLGKAEQLVRDIKNLRKMMDDASAYPPYVGQLCINGKFLTLPGKTVAMALADELTRISDEAAAIGLEFDE